MARTRTEFGTASVNSSVRAFMADLVGAVSWRVGLTLGLMVCLSLTEGFGLLLLVPLLQLVGLDVQQSSLDGIAQFFSSAFTAIGMRPNLIVVLGLYVLVISMHALLYRSQVILNFTLQHAFVASLRQRLYRSIAEANWLFFSRSRASDFMHLLTTEMERIGEATDHLLYLIATGMVTIPYIVFALRLSAVMTVLVFTCGVGLMWLLRGKTRVARVAGEELSRAMSSLYASVTEHLGGMKTAKSYGAEDRHADLFATLTERVRRTYVHTVRNGTDLNLWLDIGSVLVLSLIVYISFEVLAIRTAEVLLLLFLYARIMPKFSNMLQSYQSFVNLLAAFTGVKQVQVRCEAAAEPRAERVEDFRLRQGIQFGQVSFGYRDNGSAPVVWNLDLIIKTGQTTAIVGPSGAGKSTIADLVTGLLVPDQGRVLVDGIPLSPQRMKTWRDQIGYVSQETFLFHDTVRANLLWARTDASEEEINQALRNAAAADFVSRLHKGLETVLGDRGVLVSAGERQRLALAQALLRRPSLLILDEAMSNVDSENERQIRSAVERLHGTMTILVITHRLSTIRNADVIYVLEQGRLVESGTWDALVAEDNGRFRALCTSQGIECPSAAELLLATDPPLQN
ncbi:MAG: ABC transporter ATP-binding protein [candidate division NC10 bacterium]|nr:ABC transporter ATP-binding protein [candidate division NC10 bacterium]